MYKMNSFEEVAISGKEAAIDPRYFFLFKCINKRDLHHHNIMHNHIWAPRPLMGLGILGVVVHVNAHALAVRARERVGG